MKHFFRLMVVAVVLTAVCAWAQQPAAGGSSTLPPQWDSRIPLPKGAVLLSSETPKEGVVYTADFSAPADYDYKKLVDFYEKGLAKAGFKLGPKVAVPARKVYNRTFTYTDILDSIVISPDTKDPSKLTIHIAYTPPPKR